MKKFAFLTALIVITMAMTASATKGIRFDYATTLSSAQKMSGGEKPILIEFYTDW
jgi:hypothetical protein